MLILAVCCQGYQTGYVYLYQADRLAADDELAASSGISSSLTASDRDLAARIGLAAVSAY